MRPHKPKISRQGQYMNYYRQDAKEIYSAAMNAERRYNSKSQERLFNVRDDGGPEAPGAFWRAVYSGLGCTKLSIRGASIRRPWPELP